MKRKVRFLEELASNGNVVLNLYKQFGFKKEYSYWYMKK